MPVLQAMTPEAVARFWALVRKREPDQCWPWTRPTIDGYGVFWVGGRILRATRVALAMKLGRELGDDVACHTCDNPWCVNPAHLFAGSHGDNRRDWAEKYRRAPGRAKTHQDRMAGWNAAMRD